MIVIASHAVFLHGKDVHGPPHAVSEYLNLKKHPHLFLKHPLFGERKSLIEEYRKGKLNRVSQEDCLSPFSFFRYMKEIALTVRKVRQQDQVQEVFIGVDPLNMLAGSLLKRTGRVGKLVYFSADFAIKRFPNPGMNLIYHLLDRFAMLEADQTWSVSQRIVAFRRAHGLSEKKNKLLPNAPFYNQVQKVPITKKRPHDIVMVSALEKGVEFELLIRSVHEVSKKIPDIRLLLIGAGSLEQSLKEFVRDMHLEKKVLFLGPLSHAKMFQVLVNAGLGVALYTDSDTTHFRYFSDPMKVRDYLASGLPVLVSGNSGIGEEVEKANAGWHIPLKQHEVAKLIHRIFSNKRTLATMSAHAKKLAVNNDTYALLETFFDQLLEGN